MPGDDLDQVFCRRVETCTCDIGRGNYPVEEKEERNKRTSLSFALQVMLLWVLARKIKQ